MALPATLNFEGVEVRIIDRSGKPWITQNDLAAALYGLKGGPHGGDPLKAALKLFDRNRDEFTADMTALMTMETAGGPQQVRIYSARGCYLMALRATTEFAKRFRVWVLDVLEGKSTLSGADKVALQERRLNVMGNNAATRTVEVLHRIAGPRAAAVNAPAIFAHVGIDIDMSQSTATAQGRLKLAVDNPMEQERSAEAIKTLVDECRETFGEEAAQQLEASLRKIVRSPDAA